MAIADEGELGKHLSPVILDLRSEAEECRGAMPEP